MGMAEMSKAVIAQNLATRRRLEHDKDFVINRLVGGVPPDSYRQTRLWPVLCLPQGRVVAVSEERLAKAAKCSVPRPSDPGRDAARRRWSCCGKLLKAQQMTQLGPPRGFGARPGDAGLNCFLELWPNQESQTIEIIYFHPFQVFIGESPTRWFVFRG